MLGVPKSLWRGTERHARYVRYGKKGRRKKEKVAYGKTVPMMKGIKKYKYKNDKMCP